MTCFVMVPESKIDHLYNVFEAFSENARFQKRSVFEQSLKSARQVVDFGAKIDHLSNVFEGVQHGI